MSITNNLQQILKDVPPHVSLVAVSKYHEVPELKEAYDAEQRIFGESKAQELIQKHEELPLRGIQWHFIGHLQSNKIKFIAPFVSLIHSIDSLRLLKNVNKEALKVDRVIPCLIQLHIAEEDSKYGFTLEECKELFKSNLLDELKNVKIVGLMGMATNTDDMQQVSNEFQELKDFFDYCKEEYFSDEASFKELSMGMSHDYQLAIAKGSTLIRVGSKIFGERIY